MQLHCMQTSTLLLQFATAQMHFLIAQPTLLPPPPASHLVQPAARAPTGALDGFFGVQRNLQERHTAVNDEQEGDGAEVEHCRGRRKPPGRLHA